MDVIISMIISAAQTVGLDGATVSVLTLTVIGLMWRYVFSPTNRRVHQIPTVEDVAKIVDVVHSAHMKELSDVAQKLADIESKLTAIATSENTGMHNMSEIRRDIEVVKTILNQFQGHMMYKAPPFDSNKELR